MVRSWKSSRNNEKEDEPSFFPSVLITSSALASDNSSSNIQYTSASEKNSPCCEKKTHSRETDNDEELDALLKEIMETKLNESEIMNFSPSLPFNPQLMTTDHLFPTYNSNSNINEQGLSPPMPYDFFEGAPLPVVDPQTFFYVQFLAEYYMSDDFLQRNSFILRHVLRNRHGFVSMKLLASFKRLKSISGDYRIVSLAVSRSSFLQLNDRWTKVRRVTPINLNEPINEHGEQISTKIYIQVPILVIYPIPQIPSETTDTPSDTPFGITCTLIHQYFENVTSITLSYSGQPCQKYNRYFNDHPHALRYTVAFVEFKTPDLIQTICQNWSSDSHLGTQAEIYYVTGMSQVESQPRTYKHQKHSSVSVLEKNQYKHQSSFSLGQEPKMKSCARHHSFHGVNSSNNQRGNQPFFSNQTLQNKNSYSPDNNYLISQRNLYSNQNSLSPPCPTSFNHLNHINENNKCRFN